ncbi:MULTISPECIES: DUF2332 domain-containing protein [unclassified Streptomyces]|uniref:DUF2332 domain-containing protein n=1 Tax=unclassified Streptomyces TaxID=2593676 RepID=UPI00088520D8|nr:MULTISPECIES: DUF2332 domain-containing protein [unclassified Streptomyces]PBC83335.1 uncharacterized protein DUF2332 [Streptomyces sp. 2321.6]SDR43299.1 hypothetical protein SAMN05216511_3930 [Streptomyces sp. KS_16]SEC92895.1 hypothetical protein SAMN05428940_3274 [Streptomyces sp. 2133.1]SEE80547.1 hypothetical protein SAMN05428954_3958 [Streptomyces sp. 2112.3]SNC69413.1 hypothetical protein SAMN06272741_3265 [Streptomyces sp. 2114.4]
MAVNAGNTGNTRHVERTVVGTWGLAERYREFSWRQARGRSAAHEELSARISHDPELCDLVSGSLPAGGAQQPELLLATVRYLDGPHAELGPRGETAYGRWREWTVRHWNEVRAVIMQRSPRTDEPAHCATLLPLLARLPQPLALLEVGTSAGLCLHPDRYRYRYLRRYEGDGGSGAPLTEAEAAAEAEAGAPESPLVLECRTGWTADELLPGRGRMPRIVWRAGIGLDPLDPAAEPDDLRWLQALVWPGDEERAARLSAAVEAVRPAPRPRLVRGDLLQELPALAAEAPPGATLVIFHSAALADLAPARREEFTHLVRSLLRRRPGGGHWVSHEHPSVLPWIPAPARRSPHPDDARLLTLALDERPVALTGPHGESLHRFPGAEGVAQGMP